MSTRDLHPAPPPAHPFELDERVRYARHFVLPGVGEEGQRRLRAASVLLIGAGGLGSPAAVYLAAAGVGRLGIVDADDVDASNLQRQIAHGTRDLGRPKVESARDHLSDLNPHVDVVTFRERLSSSNALALLEGWDVVVDGSDNFPTRYLVNDACILLGIPNVYGAVSQWEGQVSVFGHGDGPCYRCLFREPPPPGLVPNCAEAGVLGVLPGVIGSLQAMEALKLILGTGSPLSGRLLLFDAAGTRFREVRLRRNPECPVCGDEPTQTELIDYELFCGITPVEEIEPAEAAARLTAVGDSPAAAGDGDRPSGGGAQPRPFLLDVREPHEWELTNLSGFGAHLIPLGALDERIDELPRDREILIYCEMGGRSAEAGRRLTAAGFTRVSNVAGGIRRWQATVPDGVVDGGGVDRGTARPGGHEEARIGDEPVEDSAP